MIVIEIENPGEVAERESAMARIFGLGRLAPELVRRKVEERVAELIRTSLAERGVRARVTWE